MSALPIAIQNTGLVTAVGYSAPASCAAIQAKVTNPSETRFADPDGAWLMAHQVVLEKPWMGLTKLTHMAALAIEEALADIPADEWRSIPLLLCVAEQDRPGRLEGLDGALFTAIQERLGTPFAPNSAIVAHGRVAAAVALSQARTLLYNKQATRVMIAAADSLVSWPALDHYQSEGRLLNSSESNGFMPGEAAGALLVGLPAKPNELVCIGVGFGVERAHVASDLPLRADGLVQAIKAALTDAGIAMHDVDYRITDLSGEHYYFKEAALALSRTLRKRKEEFDIWHPAECTGEVGAAVGTTVIAMADAASRNGFGKGNVILAHFSNDNGRRAAVSLRFQG